MTTLGLEGGIRFPYPTLKVEWKKEERTKYFVNRKSFGVKRREEKGEQSEEEAVSTKREA